MPHFSIEYSANLDGRIDMMQLCRTVSKTILDTGLFEVGAVRVRAFRAEAYAIADQQPQNSFMDLVFRIGEGRTSAEKERVGDAIFDAVAGAVREELASPHFALSLEIREIDAALSWKKNSMHPRLRTPSEAVS